MLNHWYILALGKDYTSDGVHTDDVSGISCKVKQDLQKCLCIMYLYCFSCQQLPLVFITQCQSGLSASSLSKSFCSD